jgi:hypothetical protein
MPPCPPLLLDVPGLSCKTKERTKINNNFKQQHSFARNTMEWTIIHTDFSHRMEAAEEEELRRGWVEWHLKVN